MSSQCLHPGRPSNARCDGCPFMDHGAPTPALATHMRELEPSLEEQAGPLHPCDEGCLFEAEAQRAS